MVSLMTVNDTFGCRDTLSRAIRVFYPDLNFKALDTAVCLGDVVSFMADLRDIYKSYAWHTGTEWKPDSAGRLPYTYKDTGVYTIILVGEDIHNCYDTVVRNSYILVAKPQMKAIGTPMVGCAPLPVLFRDRSTDTKGAYVTSRKWLFGDATPPRTTTFDTVSHVYPAGNYKVMLVATDNVGCIDSLTLNVESRRPVVDFISNVDTIACRGHIVSFYNRSVGPGLSFRWYFGDGGTSTDKDPTHVYTSFGSFSVKLVVTDASGCKDSLTKVGFIRTQSPKADFDVSDSVALCPPLFVSFTNKSSADAVGRLWDFDNGSSSSVDNPTAPYLGAGVYTIVLVVKDRIGCTDTARRQVRVFGYDGALKYGPLKGCAPLSVDFEAELIKAEVMIWDFADGVTESSPGKYKTTHVYTRPGTYVPQMILGDGHGCTASSRGRDTIRVDGIEPRIVTSPACIGVDISVSDSSTSPFSDYASSEWLLDDGSVVKSRTITRNYTRAGTYPLRLISANTNGCIDTIYYDLLVHDLPQIRVADTVICLNDAATLLASGGVSYEWTPDPTLSCTDCAVAMANPKVPTVYYVTGTDANGCRNKDTVTVGIKTKTRLIMPGDTNVCAQTPIRLEVSGAQRYTWIPPLYLDDATKSSPVAILDTTITYIVIGREGSCIPDTGRLRILVHPLPEVNAGEDQRVLAGSMVTLNGSSQRVKEYLWQPGDSLDCVTCPITGYRARVTTTFTLKGITDHGCVDSDDVTIVVFCDQSQLFIPNTFTPNGDGQNDVFYPRGSGVGKIKALRIYNRWGQLVFERLNMDVNAAGQGWDGNFKNEQLNPDVYVYTLEATCDTGEQIFWKGDVTIIR
jgi:gliding motility-associated-like protein